MEKRKGGKKGLEGPRREGGRKKLKRKVGTKRKEEQEERMRRKGEWRQKQGQFDPGRQLEG